MSTRYINSNSVREGNTVGLVSGLNVVFEDLVVLTRYSSLLNWREKTSIFDAFTKILVRLLANKFDNKAYVKKILRIGH